MNAYPYKLEGLHYYPSKKSHWHPDPLWIILTIIIVIFIIAIAINVWGAEIDWSNFSNEEIIQAIFKAEGGYKATYLYGIRSIDTKGNKEYARQICLNSVRNGRARWIKAGRPLDLIVYISLRYCPIGANNDNGTNKFWVKNIKYFLMKGERDE